VPARLRLIAWTLLLVALAATFYMGARRRRDFVDFLVYRTAADRAIRAEPLYRAEDGHYQFKYWPAFALAMTPLAALDSEPARIVWYGALCVMLAAYVRWSVRELPNRRLSMRLLTWVTILLLAKSIVQELVNGQTNLLLGLLLFGAFVAARHGHRAASGALVGLGMFVKPYAVVLVPWLAAVAGAPAILAFAGTVVALLLGPAVIYGWQGNLDLLAAWYRTVTDTTAPNLLFPENISLAAMWAKWIGAGPAASALSGLCGVALLALALAVWLKGARLREPGYLEVAFCLLLIPLLSPQGWDYVLLLATPAFVVLADRFREMSVGWRCLTAVGFALTSLTIFDLLGRSVYTRLTGWSGVTVGALILAAGLAQLRWRALA